ncbi:MAG: Rrf2 family transcriptional regulator [Deltaproteobacteria bacterium]|nr:Rrf2 family transcriptional regulator [Deltaproteobacteria bacterium]
MAQTAEYALRVMAEMAVQRSRGPFRARDLAKKAHVPPAFLSKVMRQLVKAGLLEARHGRGGGFFLTRPLSKISFAEILAAVGSEFESNRCLFGWKKCPKKNPCLLHNQWKGMKGRLLRWAKETTLKDVRQDRPRIST